MRVIFIPPRREDYLSLYTELSYIGGNHNGDIRSFQSPVYYQRGSGLFSVIGSLVRRSIHFLKPIFLPAVADVGRNIVTKYSQGVPLREAAKQ